MTKDEFWSVMNAAAPSEDCDDRIRAVISQLEGLPGPALAGFRDRMRELLAEACTGEVYAAGVLLTGRTFDAERFEQFRVLLLLRGRTCFEQVMADADRLAEYEFSQQEKELEFDGEMLLYAPQFAWQELAGEEADLDADYPPVEVAERAIEFQYDKEELMRRFPRSWARRRAMIVPREVPEL